jgi:hypothetical protein
MAVALQPGLAVALAVALAVDQTVRPDQVLPEGLEVAHPQTVVVVVEAVALQVLLQVPGVPGVPVT